MTTLLDPPETDPRTDAQQTAVGSAAAGQVPVPRWAWGRLLVATTARMVLALVCSMAVWAVLPLVLGWQPTTVVTGSMQPRILIGDVVVAKPTATEDLRVGQLLLFPDPDHADRLRLHRFVDVDEAGLIVTRGDANEADDSTHVDPLSVDGVAVLRIPHLGRPVVWFHEQRWSLVAATGAVVVALVALSGLDQSLRRDPGSTVSGRSTGGDDRTGARPDQPAVRRHPVLVHRLAGRRARLVVAGTAGLLALVVVLLTNAPAWAAYRTTTGTTAALSSARYYACDSAPTADRPYLYWKLDETSGTNAADASGNNRAGTYVNGFTNAAAACGRGSAVTLDGTSQYLTTSSTTAVAGPNTFTIEAWFRSSRGGMIGSFGNARTGGSSQHDRKIYLTEAGRVYFGVYPGTAKTISSGAGFADNRWHHVVATLSGNGMRLYLDGVQVASDTTTTTAESYNGFWRFGYDTQGGWPDAPTSGYLAGSLDNVAVYATALTATQVADHYNSR